MAIKPKSRAHEDRIKALEEEMRLCIADIGALTHAAHIHPAEPTEKEIERHKKIVLATLEDIGPLVAEKLQKEALMFVESRPWYKRIFGL